MDGPADEVRLSLNIQQVSNVMIMLMTSPPRLDDATMASLNIALWAATFDRLLANMDPNAIVNRWVKDALLFLNNNLIVTCVPLYQV